MVADPDLTLAEGAIRGWDRRNIYRFLYAQLISRSLWLRRRGAFKKLSKKHRDAILHGSGKQQIDFSYANDRGIIRRRHRFEGVLPNMERRFRETDSSMVKKTCRNTCA